MARPAVNLDRKNPRGKEDITHLPPEQLAEGILQKEQRIAEIMGNIQKLLAKPVKPRDPTPMTEPASMPFSDYIVFVDETGDHGMANVNQDYPLFGLAFCVFKKSDYIENVTAALRRLKFATFGHDLVVLHEHDIRKKENAFAQMSREPRETFLAALTQIIEGAPFTLVTVVIDKRNLTPETTPQNLYHLALLFGLERVFGFLKAGGQANRVAHIVVECRGKREDTELELEFRRICEGANELNCPLPFRLVMADKRSNSEGLQLADMVARPVALSVLRPGQPNRAFAILQAKFWRDSKGRAENCGLKVFRGKVKGHREVPVAHHRTGSPIPKPAMI